MDVLKKQGFDPNTGKDRIGQDIEKRSYGKLAPPASCKVMEPSKTSPNFKRATISVSSPNAIKGEEFLELRENSNSDNTRDSELPEFQKGAKGINPNSNDVIKGGR